MLEHWMKWDERLQTHVAGGIIYSAQWCVSSLTESNGIFLNIFFKTTGYRKTTIGIQNRGNTSWIKNHHDNDDIEVF